MLVFALSFMAAGAHLIVYGGVVSGSLPIMLHLLQSSVGVWACALCWGAAAIIALLRLVSPRSLAALDRLLPCSARPPQVRKRRYSDADMPEPADADGLTGVIVSFWRWLQEAEQADNILVGTLTVLWHASMALPIVMLCWDKKVQGEARMMLWGIVVVSGLVLAGSSVWRVVRSGIWSGSEGPSRGSGSGSGGGRKDRGEFSATASQLLFFPLLLHGAAALFFLYLHVDVGGELHWSPFHD